MSVLADVFVSTDDVAATENHHSSVGPAYRAQLKNFTALELSTLWSILREVEWNTTLLAPGEIGDLEHCLFPCEDRA